ncbi:MAG TPA: ATP-binding protein [Anaerolineae bacterium]|nr:ATP-binding protein [Anaerolineae bacterium]
MITDSYSDLSTETNTLMLDHASPLEAISIGAGTWKILLVDDDKLSHPLIQRHLQNLNFKDKRLEFISAYSAAQAIRLIEVHPDTAVILLDMVMEEPDSGLKVADYVRNTIGNQLVRIILQTGRSEELSIAQLILDYDINDYKVKTRFTPQELVITVLTSLKSFDQLITIEQHRTELTQLSATIASRSIELYKTNQLLGQEIAERMQAMAEKEILLAAEREQRLLAETLAEVTIALTSQLSQEAVLEEILRQVRRLVPFKNANIMFLEGGILRIGSWQGYDDPKSQTLISNLVQYLSDIPIDLAAVNSRQPIVVPNTHQEPDWVTVEETAWIQSYAVVPICVGERVMGLLRLDADAPAAFSEADIARMQPLANAAAIALENAELYGYAQLEIAERKYAEQSLVDSLEFLEILIDTIPNPVFFKNAEGVYQGCNTVFASEILGLTRQDVMGKSIDDLTHIVPPDLADIYRRADAQLLRDQGNKVYEAKVKRPDGQLRDFIFNKTVFKNSRGEVAGIVGVMLDITERKQAEAALKRAHAQNEQILTSISWILIGIQPDHRITHWNGPAEVAFGLIRSEAIGQRLCCCSIRWNWSKIKHGIDECHRTGQSVYLHDISFMRADEREGFLEVTITPFAGEAPEQSGLLLLAEDITERKALQLHLAQAQKLEAVGQLAAGIAHEINTPTQYIGDNIGFIQDSLPKIDQVLAVYQRLLTAATSQTISPELIAEVESTVSGADLDFLMEELPLATEEARLGIERVTHIVRAMKEFSHPGVEQKTMLDLNHAIENTITVARNEWKYVAEVETDFDPDLPLVECLPGELNQVILNLLVNAAHAIADVVGNEVGSEKGLITVKTCHNENWIEVRIQDTGTGIPEEIRRRIFDPFFTTKEVGKGTGQGLAISHAVIVEKHRGVITFETELGRGTTFIIRLPRSLEVEEVPGVYDV